MHPFSVVKQGPSARQQCSLTKSRQLTKPHSIVRCKSFQTDTDRRVPPPPPPPPPPPAPTSQAPWWKPTRRDFAVALLGSLIGGAAMYIIDTNEFNEIFDELEQQDQDLLMMETYIQQLAAGQTAPSLEALQNDGGQGSK